MDYYKKKLFIPQINKNDGLIGKIERWQAHRQAILHRGFTTIIKSGDKIILQKRKHPVFDGVYDLSFSSHPVFIQNQLQTMEEAVLKTFQREWLVGRNAEIKIKFLDKYYYRAADKKSGYFEHEINYLYLIDFSGEISDNPQFSYQMKIITIKDFFSKFNKINLAPWVKKHYLNFLGYPPAKQKPTNMGKPSHSALIDVKSH
ncbi:MAG: hypothetical protein QHH09_02135 [Microgenomates group bacterium]|nr:hypothetical protein [Microgenomates group bacterium]